MQKLHKVCLAVKQHTHLLSFTIVTRTTLFPEDTKHRGRLWRNIMTVLHCNKTRQTDLSEAVFKKVYRM